MNHSVQLKSAIPPELVDEFLKRLPYVSESLVEYDPNTDSRDQAGVTLDAGGDDQAAIVSSHGAENFRCGQPQKSARDATRPPSNWIGLMCTIVASGVFRPAIRAYQVV